MLTWLKAACLLALLALICTLEYGLVVPGRPMLAHLSSSASKFDSAMDSVNTAAARQADAQIEFKKDLANLHDVLIHTDLSLNGRAGVLPVLSAAVSNQDAQLTALEKQATASIAEVQEATRQAEAVLGTLEATGQSLAALAANPAFLEALERLDDATGKANAILASVDAIAASGNRDAQMLETRLRQALKPASLAKSIFLHALGLAGPAAQIATAVK